MTVITTIKPDQDYRVKFRGFEFVMDGSGALATEEAMRAGEVSFAHVYSERNEILCFNQKIGEADEIELLEMIDPVSVGIGILFASWTRYDWEQVYSDRAHIIKRDVTDA